MYSTPIANPNCSKNCFSVLCIEDSLATTGSLNIKDEPQWIKIVWIKQGSADFRDGFLSSVVPAGQICLLTGKGSKRIQADNVVEGVVISFKSSLLNFGDLEYDCAYSSSACRAIARSGGIEVSSNVEATLSELADRMIKESSGDRLFRSEILIRYLKIFLLYLAGEANLMFGHHQKTKQQTVVENFVDKVDECFRYQKLVSEYAAMLRVTPGYLNEAVKRTTGYSAGHHIRQRIAIEAKRMALNSQNSMKEIAYNLGFADSAHFSKFFKIVSGFNFSDFKKQQQVLAIAV